jgi:hypothetical protein
MRYVFFTEYKFEPMSSLVTIWRIYALIGARNVNMTYLNVNQVIYELLRAYVLFGHSQLDLGSQSQRENQSFELNLGVNRSRI